MLDNIPQGWQCPVCGQVWSPSVLKCNCRIVYQSGGTNWWIEYRKPQTTAATPLPDSVTNPNRFINQDSINLP